MGDKGLVSREAVLDSLESDLEEVLEYFDNRMDADCDETGFIPNKEMRLHQRVTDAIAAIRALPSDAGQCEVERLRDALTPSLETKQAYMGEFQFGLPECDEDGNEIMRNVNVPWTTIKEIMAAIRARAALTARRARMEK